MVNYVKYSMVNNTKYVHFVHYAHYNQYILLGNWTPFPLYILEGNWIQFPGKRNNASYDILVLVTHVIEIASLLAINRDIQKRMVLEWSSI